ncbi:MAG: hypothetical protein KKE79_06590 [Actinobacteria bacterium]|nr:hypothetical protein [Actinomycetota bacterium]
MGDILNREDPGACRGAPAERWWWRGATPKPAGRGLPLAGLAVLVTVAAVLATLAMTGCSSTADKVNDYLGVAGGVVDGMGASLSRFDALWTVPLSAQGGIKVTLVGFRKALADGQSEVDSVDAPEPCRELSGLLWQCLDRGRELADMTTQFADYIDDMAPIARQIDEVTVTLQGLMDRKDIPSGFFGLYDKVNDVNSSFGTVLPPSTFQEVHHRFGEFVRSMVKDFKKAHDRLGDWGLEDEEDEGEPSGYEEGDPEEEPEEEDYKKETPENRAIEPILKGIPGEWGRLCGEVAAMFDALRESTGLKHKEAVVRDLVGQAEAMMQALEKEYK